jgi:hypothetical protein|tara:strand:- start:613 stop:834 length:222 start_codon:yes stop_codon:yes gene_type:complete
MSTQVTVVLHEKDGYKIKVAHKSIISEALADKCGLAALQEYNAEQRYYKLVGFATDAYVYSDNTGKLITKVKP